MEEKIIIGLTEKITVMGPNGKKKRLLARIDTGATKSSMDVKTAAEMHLGPISKTKMVRSAIGTALRPVVEVEVIFCGKRFKAEFTLADRSHMKYPVLIGQNMMKDGHWMIDPSKS